MANELLEAGLPRSVLYPPSEAFDRARWRRLLRRLIRFPRAMVLDLYLRLKHPWLSEDDAAVIIGRDACLRFLRRNWRVWLILNSDMSPRRLILAEAAETAGTPSVWWQDDFHHMPPRIAFKGAALLNVAAQRGVEAISPGTLLYHRPIAAPRRARPIPSAPRVGVAVNAFFTAKPEELELLTRFRQDLGVETLVLRLHPRTSKELRESLPAWLEVHDAAESVESFCLRVNLVLVGNSAVQLRVLASGTAVLHVAGLDPHGFDLNGYVGRDIVFGADPFCASSIHEARIFYETSDYFAHLQHELSRPAKADVHSLNALVNRVLGRVSHP